MSVPVRYEPDYKRAARWSNPTDDFVARVWHAAKQDAAMILLALILTVSVVGLLFGAWAYGHAMDQLQVWTQQAPCMAATKHLLDLNTGVNATEGQPVQTQAHEQYEEGLVKQADAMAAVCQEGS